MKTILVTGGTVFVSRYVASHFAARGDRVYVLNRGTRPQAEGVTPLLADRHALGGLLRSMAFDAVLDMTAYQADDVSLLLDALSDFGTYVLLSSSAVYPETAPQPFQEETALGPNRFWGAYGLGKIEAEQALLAAPTPMTKGLNASLAWYVAHPDAVNRKPYLEYIDRCPV